MTTGHLAAWEKRAHSTDSIHEIWIFSLRSSVLVLNISRSRRNEDMFWSIFKNGTHLKRSYWRFFRCDLGITWRSLCCWDNKLTSLPLVMVVTLTGFFGAFFYKSIARNAMRTNYIVHYNFIYTTPRSPAMRACVCAYSISNYAEAEQGIYRLIKSIKKRKNLIVLSFLLRWLL